MASTPTTPVTTAAAATPGAPERDSVSQVTFNNEAETKMMEKYVSWYRNRPRILDLDSIKSSEGSSESYRLLDLIATLVYQERGIEGIWHLMENERGRSIEVLVRLINPQFVQNTYLLLMKAVPSPLGGPQLWVTFFSGLSPEEVACLARTNSGAAKRVPRPEWTIFYKMSEDNKWELPCCHMSGLKAFSDDKPILELVSYKCAWSILQVLRAYP